MYPLRALRRSSSGPTKRGNSDSPPRRGIASQIFRGARNSIEFVTPFRNEIAKSDTTKIDEQGDRMVKDDFVYDLSNQQRDLFNTTTPHGSSEAHQDAFNETESVIEDLYRNVTVRQKIHDNKIDHNQDGDEWEPSLPTSQEPGRMVSNEDNNVSSQVPLPGGELKNPFRNSQQRLRNRDDNENDSKDVSQDPPPEYHGLLSGSHTTAKKREEASRQDKQFKIGPTRRE